MIGGVAVRGANEVAVGFLRTEATTRAATDAVVRRAGVAYVTAVRGRASGRPGPRAITGNYRRSWTSQTRKSAAGTQAVCGTNAPQGRRLEYGFNGADSLGRVYRQPPYPHAGPAFDEVQPRFLAELEAVVGKIL
jgi:hypothetical protein